MSPKPMGHGLGLALPLDGYETKHNYFSGREHDLRILAEKRSAERRTPGLNAQPSTCCSEN